MVQIEKAIAAYPQNPGDTRQVYRAFAIDALPHAQHLLLQASQLNQQTAQSPL